VRGDGPVRERESFLGQGRDSISGGAPAPDCARRDGPRILG
jgi:hypothetical protein